MLDYDHFFNIGLIGAAKSGKTGLCLRFAINHYSETYYPTALNDYRVCNLQLNEKKCKLQIWDYVDGPFADSFQHERPRSLVLVYDTTDITSLETLKVKIEEIEGKIDESIPLFLVGTKNDLIDTVQINEQMVKSFVNQQNSTGKHTITYVGTTSAKTEDRVEEAFRHITEYLLNRVDPSYSIEHLPRSSHSKRARAEYDSAYRENQHKSTPSVNPASSLQAELKEAATDNLSSLPNPSPTLGGSGNFKQEYYPAYPMAKPGHKKVIVQDSITPTTLCMRLYPKVLLRVINYGSLQAQYETDYFDDEVQKICTREQNEQEYGTFKEALEEFFENKTLSKTDSTSLGF